MATTTARPTGPGSRRVPAEHRVLGLDRRSFPLALSVLVVFLVSAVAIPRINDVIAWEDPMRAGQQLALTDSMIFTSNAGWQVEAGYRTGEDGAAASSGAAVVVGEGVTLQVTPDDFEGTPAELIAQIDKVSSATTDPTFQADGALDTVTTTDGAVGVLQTYSSVRGDGVIAAFVIDGTGVEVTAYGPPAQMTAAADAVTSMITSIRAQEVGA